MHRTARKKPGGTMTLRILLIALVLGLVLAGCTQQTASAAPASPSAPNYTTERMNGTQIIPPAPTWPAPREPAPVKNTTPAAPAPLPRSQQIATFKKPQLVYGAEQTILKQALDYRALCEKENIDLGTHILTLKKADLMEQPARFDFELLEERNNQPYAVVGDFSLSPGEYQPVSIAGGPSYAIAAKYDEQVKSGSGCIGVTVYSMPG
ncbi:Uncharacterised protein [uncultured archaeon]|nr:Uncharacterised protein [uncultured archaeon]